MRLLSFMGNQQMEFFWFFAWSYINIKPKGWPKPFFREKFCYEVFRSRKGPQWAQNEVFQVLWKIYAQYFFEFLLKAFVRYFSLFLKEQYVSWLFRTKYFEIKFNLQLLYLPIVSWAFILPAFLKVLVSKK